MKYEELEKLIIGWADDRGILSQSNSLKQLEKTQEELDETVFAIERQSQEGIIDGFGDMLVTIIIAAKTEGVDLIQCLESAWNVIKHRKGKMIDGKFVKEVE